MAASAKRKQEEKHLKMLREMTSLPPNRKCFDCDQRGPTYANMTVGSFVCTSCSGILRGLNPPHRVKSISMTTFTQQEIEFLQKHGNESCKQIWLGLYDDRTASIPDFREPQKVKEFLQEKYEKKRWFVPPEQAKVVASVHASISGSSASSTSSTPEVRPLKTLLGESAPTLHLNKHTPSQSPVGSRAAQALQLSQQQQFHDNKFDLLSDLGGDIFAAPPHSQTAAGSAANFANFAHFNSQPGGSVPSGVPGSLPPGVSAGLRHPQSQLTGTSAADRYAALAELDTVFGSSAPSTSVYNTVSTSQGGMFGPVTGVSSAQAQQCMSSMPQGFGDVSSSLLPGLSTNPFAAAAVAPATATTNPFQSNGRAAAVAAAATFGTGSMSMPAGFGNAATYNLPTSFSGTFQPPFPGQAPFPQPPAYPQQPNGVGFSAFGQAKAVGTPFGQAMAVGTPFGQAMAVGTPYGQAMAAPGASSNPFLAGAPSGHYPSGSSSTNPFL
ncbi:arf-GAP domain and FG repeat-containing protein 1 isoform X5 [Salmo salar]|uniref:Arf-GAP domain and FG repeat-containing protein 1 isoform X5 n=1 Tax=Salmo salar TaxID=8030 RepID=A0A1S3SYA5_SALSA|nr:arf-GAP domain and FG repeat-containing protein 1-like isoform X5 [Salmo salar]|eukprot:XP_014069319.1 PREDICTED: arf-GAP domain and FG repeat-containing protein 1-like isoform X5 [Salmo salar]